MVLQSVAALLLIGVIVLPLLGTGYATASAYATSYVRTDPVLGVVSEGLKALFEDACEHFMERCSNLLNK